MNSPGSHTPLERASLHHPHAVLRTLHPHTSTELDPGHSSITANCPTWPPDLNTNKAGKVQSCQCRWCPGQGWQRGCDPQCIRGSKGSVWGLHGGQQYQRAGQGHPGHPPAPAHVASWAPENVTLHPPPQTMFSESQGWPCRPSDKGARCPGPTCPLAALSGQRQKGFQVP